MATYQNKWLYSYETLKFNTTDGDIDIGQYAPDGNLMGYYIRTKPKGEAQFDWVDLTYKTAGLKKVSIVAGGHAYYTHFLTAQGATALWSAVSADKGKDPSQLSTGCVVRTQITKEQYFNVASVKNYPQPTRTEVVSVIPPIEPAQPHNKPSSIALDATSNSGLVGAVSGYSWSHTCGATADLLVFGDSHQSSTDYTISAATYNSVAITAIRTDGWSGRFSYGRSTIRYLLAPATGSAYTVAITYSGTVTNGVGGVVSYSGAKQSGQPDAHNGATPSSTNATVTVTTVADNSWVVAVIGVAYSATISSCNNTLRWQGSNNFFGGSDTNAPKTLAGGQAMSWTLSGNVYSDISAASFAPAGGGGTTTKTLSSLLGEKTILSRVFANNRTNATKLGIKTALRRGWTYIKSAKIGEASSTIKRAVSRVIKTALLGVKTSINRLFVFNRTFNIAKLGEKTLSSASRVLKTIRFFSTAKLGEKVSYAKNSLYNKINSIKLGIKTTISHIDAIKRIISILLGEKILLSRVTKTYRTFNSKLGEMVSISRRYAVKKSSTTLLGSKASVSRLFAIKRITFVKVGIKTSISRLLHILRTNIAKLGEKVSVVASKVSSNVYTFIVKLGLILPSKFIYIGNGTSKLGEKAVISRRFTLRKLFQALDGLRISVRKSIAKYRFISLLGEKINIGRLIVINRRISVLNGLKTIISHLSVFKRASVILLGIKTSIVKLYRGYRANTTKLGLKTIVSRNFRALRTLSSKIGLKTIVLNLRGWIRTLSAKLGIKTVISRLASLKRAFAIKLGLLASTTRTIASRMTIRPLLGLKSIIRRGLAVTKKILLGLKTNISRNLALKRLIKSLLGLKVLLVGQGAGIITIIANLGLQATKTRLYIAHRTFSSLLGIKTFVKRGLPKIILSAIVGLKVVARKGAVKILNILLGEKSAIRKGLAKSLSIRLGIKATISKGIRFAEDIAIRLGLVVSITKRIAYKRIALSFVGLKAYFISGKKFLFAVTLGLKTIVVKRFSLIRHFNNILGLKTTIRKAFPIIRLFATTIGMSVVKIRRLAIKRTFAVKEGLSSWMNRLTFVGYTTLKFLIGIRQIIFNGEYKTMKFIQTEKTIYFEIT